MKEYNSNGIYFGYPENWIIEESEMETAAGSIQLTNEDGAFWLLKKYPFGTNPDEIAKEALTVMQEEYDDMEVDRFDRVLFDKTITGFEMTFFYLDLMNFAKILCFEQDGLTLAVFWQTGNQLIIRNEESVPVEKVLEAVTFSLLQGQCECQHQHH
ncbi:MAG: hypothetical protein LBG58_05380 [Planctomycetaceae bacterium]|jgi:hypothetical protein|nr:hypothetical protein [Planctomycetaceae bacterium]